MKKLPPSYYLNPDVVFLAHDLLGKVLASNINGQRVTSGIIIETEAYAGETDRASHAFGGRRTKRTETMYLEGGVAYVYLCYGIHSLFNLVTNMKGVPHAILIRGIEPLEGIELMSDRTGKPPKNLKTILGPGNVTKALGINVCHDQTSLLEDLIWIEKKPRNLANGIVLASPRVGVDYAGEDSKLHYRFVLEKTV